MYSSELYDLSLTEWNKKNNEIPGLYEALSWRAGYIAGYTQAKLDALWKEHTVYVW